ncbi:NAD(P)/FAD-dependent oxidoreductase [Phaeovulum sp. W22_SRMD_FR3]|uniref:NAD(P)/FAD-dependent oxidoreductase n=1 Tax=Phaeovulum sp. W22_SRMD_FR3 TaxID=3240274 RepID=UPI003F9E1E3B
MENAGIVIIGAGQAAASLAARLRSKGHAGAITIIGAEPLAPYQRPPLSKAYLLGDMPLDRLLLRSDDFWAEQKITLRLGQRVTAIDPAARTVTLGDEVLGYEQLALTTGATPRRLPAAMGGDLDGVFTVRNLADIDGLKPLCRAGAAMVVIGGGYIGLEAASVASKLGMMVTVIEAAPRILGRVASPETAQAIREMHDAHRVRILEGVGIEALVGSNHVTAVRLAGGAEIAADIVITGIGVTPDTDLAEAAGLACENGIAVDAYGQTSAPAVWAAGDCASFPYGAGPSGTGRLRLESVGNAIDMAELVADNMLGAGIAYVPKPWFWSDQFDEKLQIAGLNTGYDRIVTRISDVGQSFWYYAGERLLAVDALNDSRAYMVGKRLIEAGRSPDPIAIADPATDLKALLKA